MRFLVFTTDVIPLPGLPTSGTALRTFGIIQGLRACGHEVLVSVPKSALAGMLKSTDLASLSAPVRSEIEQLQTLAFDSLNQVHILSQSRADVIICGHWPAFTFQTKPSQVVVIDLAGPHLLERHFQGTQNQAGAILAKLSAIASADYFIVSGPKQRLYFLSFMLRAGVENPERRIMNITMPLNPEAPHRIPSTSDEFPRFVFGGVFLPWQNPTRSLQQTAQTVLSRSRGSLKLIGGSHPNYKIRDGVYAELFANLAKNPFVKTLPMLPYDDFLGELKSSDVAIDLMQWNLERDLAMTIRSTSYLRAGVPVIYNDYADLGKLIKKYDAGWTVRYDDPLALDSVLTEVYEHPEIVERKSANATRLAREEFAWDRAVRPLLERLEAREPVSSREIDIIVDFPDNANLTVLKEQPVEQVFFSRLDGLSRLECRLATHDRKLKEPLRFTLYEILERSDPLQPLKLDAPRKKLLEQTADAAQIKNNEWFALDWDRVPDSAGKTFSLKIESANSAAEESFSPWAVRAEPFPLLGLFHGGRRIENASLCLRTSCIMEPA